MTQPVQAREGQTYGGNSLLARYASFVKLPHTLFALPFAGVGAVLASYRYPDRLTWPSIAWIVIAFTAARFAAMGFNRVVDREYDARNPRTRQRELPAGRLSVTQAKAAVVVASVVFIASAWALNPLCGYLAPVALAWVFFYSYTKRFTLWSHHVLGASLAIAPVGAYLAVSGAWPTPWHAPLVLAGAVMFWVAGFDVIYSVADEEFDRAAGLRSLAARFGTNAALTLARGFHVLALTLFLALAALRLFPLGSVYLTSVAVMAALLLYEHAVVRRAVEHAAPAAASESRMVVSLPSVSDGGMPDTPAHDRAAAAVATQAPAALDMARINRAFFQTNIAVSMTIFAFTLLDRML